MAKIKGSNGSYNILGTLGADDILAKERRRYRQRDGR